LNTLTFETSIRFDTQNPRTNQESNCNQKKTKLWKRRTRRWKMKHWIFLSQSRSGLDAQVRCAFSLHFILQDVAN